MIDNRWTPTTREEYDRLVGRDVYSQDGERIGLVDRIVYPATDMPDVPGGHFIVVRPDFPTGPLGDGLAYVPHTAIAAVTADAVELNVAANEIRDQRWANVPVNLDPTSAPLPEDAPPPTEGGWYEEGHRTTD